MNSDQNDSASSLLKSSLDRKAKLAALRAKAGTSLKRSLEEEDQEPTRDERSKLKFKNYKPDTESLQSHIAQPSVIAGPEAKTLTDTVEGQVESVAQEALEKHQQLTNAGELDIPQLAAASKKQNWDLRRDLEKKLEPLERKTQAMILQLLRKRIQGSSDKLVDAAAAMSAVSIPTSSVSVGGDFDDD